MYRSVQRIYAGKFRFASFFRSEQLKKKEPAMRAPDYLLDLLQEETLKRLWALKSVNILGCE